LLRFFRAYLAGLLAGAEQEVIKAEMSDHEKPNQIPGPAVVPGPGACPAVTAHGHRDRLQAALVGGRAFVPAEERFAWGSNSA
jgi:hypothetical protein